MRTERDSGGPPLANWLADLDARATKLPRGRNWLQYPYFMFARYPHLQPEVSVGVATRRSSASDHRSFEEMLSRQEAKIAGHERGVAIFRNLSARQRHQLSALVTDLVALLSVHKKRKEHSKRLTRLAKEARRRQSGLDKRVAHVRTALERLLTYADHLDPWIGMRHRDFAQNGLTAIDELNHYQSAEEWTRERSDYLHFDQILGFTPFPNDPTGSSMAELFWFFNYECGLSARESQIRTALVRETCLARWLGPVRVVEHHHTETSESRGATAVRQAVKRYKSKS